MSLNLLKIRKAKLKDNKIIYLIRNQKTSLKYFKFIKFSEHKVWFTENLKSKKNIFYVLTIRDKVKGFVKFKNINKNISDLSYHVSESIQRKGFGTKILKEATNLFFKQHKEKKKITAKVIKNNVASLKCFRKARYEKKKVGQFIYYEFKKTNLNKKNISFFISGPWGLEFLNNYKKKKLKVNSIIVDKQSSKLFIEKVKKTNVAKKIFIADKNISKKIRDHFNKDISLVFTIFWPYILPSELIENINYKIINTHTSYLPYDRGANSYIYQILRNHPKGITIHIIDKKHVDAGFILKRKKIKIKNFTTGGQAEIILKKSMVDFLIKNFKYICNLNLNEKKFKKIDTKKFKQNFKKDIDKNTYIDLNKKYKALDLINIMLSRSGFKKGGSHFLYKKNKYLVQINVKNIND